VLRTLFTPKGKEITGEWRELLNDELQNVYSSLYLSGEDG
jgi:hypothetical protein